MEMSSYKPPERTHCMFLHDPFFGPWPGPLDVLDTGREKRMFQKRQLQTNKL